MYENLPLSMIILTDITVFTTLTKKSVFFWIWNRTNQKDICTKTFIEIKYSLYNVEILLEQKINRKPKVMKQQNFLL